MFSYTLLNHWMSMWSGQTCDRLIADGHTYAAGQPDRTHSEILADGPKYISVVMNRSVRYFIRKADGMIFASAGRKMPNFKRSFGTLTDMDDFNWGEYEACAKPGTRWMMVPTRGGYATAVALPLTQMIPGVNTNV